MRITNWGIKEEAGTVEVSANVDGFRLWYRVPSLHDVSKNGDVFLASALLPAMRQGTPLEIDPSMPVSPKLLNNAALLQEIFHTWNPKQLRVVPIVSRLCPSAPTEPINTGTASFFSGGVDSTYTLLKHADTISHLVFIQGFDFYESKETGPAFSLSDIADLSKLSYYLMTPSHGVYAFIHSQLSNATTHALAEYLTNSSLPETLDRLLIDDINRIIAGESIYEASRFKGIAIRQEVRRLLAQRGSQQSTIALNRMLLEDACPELARKGSTDYSTAMERHQRFSTDLGKTLIPVRTNYFAFGYRYNLSRDLTHGSCLGSVALLLGFGRTYVPATYTYTKPLPIGSHPFTDPLWTNERMTIVHDGCEAKRTEKIEKIHQNPAALANLRVCLDDMNKNCGRCVKCLRTMIALKLLRGDSGPFPPFPALRSIRRLRAPGYGETAYLQENIELALQSPGADGLASALQTCLRRNATRRFLVDFQKLALGDVVKTTCRIVTRFRPEFRRIDTTPPRE